MTDLNLAEVNVALASGGEPVSVTEPHTDPHLDDEGNCLCACPQCVDHWRPMRFGGERRYCICTVCRGGDCPGWRLDREMFERVVTRVRE
jgi:hypothetical protein